MNSNKSLIIVLPNVGHLEALQGHFGGNFCEVSSLCRPVGNVGLGEEEDDCTGCCGLEKKKLEKAAALKYFVFQYQAALITVYLHA